MIYFLLILGMNLGFLPISTAQSVEVELKVFLEGPFDKNSGQMKTKLYDLGYLPGMQPKSFFGKAVPMHDPYSTDQQQTLESVNYPEGSVDWLKVTIKDATTGEAVLSSTELLLANGDISMEAISTSLLSDDRSYIITLIHRNHLPVESGVIRVENNKLRYDFTSSTEGIGLKTIGKVKAMFAGNIHQSKSKSRSISINQDDIDHWRSMNGKNSSYLLEDVDLNGDISVHDQSLILENIDISSSVIINE